jgi:acetyl-CoA carboxylase alpha subunit
MLQRSTFSLIAPDVNAAILERSGRPARAWAETLKIPAWELRLLDGIVPEAGVYRRNVEDVRRLVVSELASLGELHGKELVAARRRRYLERHVLAELPSEYRGTRETA